MKIATLLAYALAALPIVRANRLNDFAELHDFVEESNWPAAAKVSAHLRTVAPRPDPLAPLVRGLPQGPAAQDVGLQAALDGSDTQDAVPGGGLRQVRDETFAAAAVGVDASALLEADGPVLTAKVAAMAFFPEDTGSAADSLASASAGTNLISVTYDASAHTGTLVRSDVLREWGRYSLVLQNAADPATIQYRLNEFHLTLNDHIPTCTFQEGQTAAFSMVGHFIEERPATKYTVNCPSCHEGVCEAAICSFVKVCNDNKSTVVGEHEKLESDLVIVNPPPQIMAKAWKEPYDPEKEEPIWCTGNADCPEGSFCNKDGMYGGNKCLVPPAPTPSTDKDDCFSLESTVIVRDQGAISIRDLCIGDMVLSDEHGTWSKFYSKGHYNEKTKTEFVQISTEVTEKPLELTPGHMVFKASSKLPVPAFSIQVGDVVKTANGPSTVTGVKKILRIGFFNPLTLSGSIVVDGVVASIASTDASTHSEKPGFEGGDTGWVYIGDHKIVHWHKLHHTIHTPHRIICGRLATCAETLNEDGFTPFSHYGLALHKMTIEKDSAIFSAFVLLAVVIFTAPFYVIELMLENAIVVFPGCCFIVGTWLVLSDVKAKMKSI